MKKIAIVTDTAVPDINGVATTIHYTIKELLQRGYDVKCITPSMFTCVRGFLTSDVKIALDPWKIFQILDEYQPDATHIATEGPLGLFARHWALKRNMAFTTAFHTNWSQWWHKNIGLASSVVNWYLKQFHSKASAVMCATPSLAAQLKSMQCTPTLWGRGVDLELFAKGQRCLTYQRPIWLYVGRVSAEKNIEQFLDLALPGTKAVVGTGPQLNALRCMYPNVKFEGQKHGLDLVNFYHSADVLVFPSEFDTFGLVLIEAIACGTPVAAKPLPNTEFIVCNGVTGVLSCNLLEACMAALSLDRTQVQLHGQKFSWTVATDQFLAALKFNK